MDYNENKNAADRIPVKSKMQIIENGPCRVAFKVTQRDKKSTFTNIIALSDGGKCVEVCPKHLISLIPYSNTVQVACSSTDKGPVTMKACTTGCVGCGICVKNCQHDAVKVENFHAVIDPEKCVGCGACMEKCPKKCIVKA